MIYSNGGMHNALTDMLIQRMQHLVGFPEAKLPEQVSYVFRQEEYLVCGLFVNLFSRILVYMGLVVDK